MALYGKADHDRDMRACDDMDVMITRKQLAGDMNGLEAKALHDKVEVIRKLYDKKLNATRFILMMNKGSKTRHEIPRSGREPSTPVGVCWLQDQARLRHSDEQESQLRRRKRLSSAVLLLPRDRYSY
jgi:hypothetical protein